MDQSALPREGALYFGLQAPAALGVYSTAPNTSARSAMRITTPANASCQ